MPRKLAHLAAVASVLGGCAVGPDFTRPSVVVAENWIEARDQRIVTQADVDRLWWKAFNDSALDRLVELAYHQNLPLQIAGLRIVEARARLGVATGRQYPQVFVATGNATSVGLSDNTANTAAIENFDRNQWQFQTGFDALWEVDLWGKYRRGVEAQRASLFASEADYQSGLVSLTAEIARTYTTIRTFELLVDLAIENAGVQEQGLRIAESRFRNGATSELDVAQARTLWESTRATIPQLQINLQQARNALSALLGQPPGSVATLLAGPRELPTPPVQVAVSVPAELLRRRPDIRRAEFNAAAQCALIGVAEAEAYPSFSLAGTIGLQSSSGAGASTNLFSTDSLAYSIGPRVAWQFFSFGRIRNSVRVEDARFQQLLVGYQDTVVRAAQEVEDALTGYLNGQEAAAFTQASVEAARRSVEIAVVQYREGAVDFQRVLDAQRSLLLQQNNLAQTRSSIVISYIALNKALGGGWELRQGQPIVSESTQKEMRERTNWGDALSPPPAAETPEKPPPGR